jgi:hypothetical protein
MLNSAAQTITSRAGRTAASLACLVAFAGSARAAFTNNIMVIGMWPPTNEMVRPFSTNAAQNPGGWQGANWEGRGYNIYSFFPEFPGGTGVNPRGEGDFQVDYQAVSADFWRLTEQLHPVAIVSFSRGNAGSSWEIESAHRKLKLSSWTSDYLAPFQPTTDLPIAQEPDNTRRNSSLPMTSIRDAVSNASLGIPTYIDTSSSFGGTFVSEFTGYHSAWYANLHAAANDPARCVAGGHIHVGIDTPLDSAILATQITLREVTTYVDSVVPAPSTLGVLAALPLASRRRRSC